MSSTTKKTIKTLLNEERVAPQKKFGQNFLVNKGIIDKVMEAAGVLAGDTVVEIGPGTGALTLELAKKAQRVIAIEKDEKMAEILKKTTAGQENIKIIRGDIRQTKIWETETKIPYKVVANIPFYLTAFLIRSFLEQNPKEGGPPLEMTLIVQKEVAQRICAKAPQMNLLAVSVQYYAKVKIAGYISKESFWPSPKVDSAIIRISDIKKKPQKERDVFFKIIKAGFCQPRKQLANNLSKQLNIPKKEINKWLLKNKVRPEQRAQTLSVDQWIDLSKSFIII